MRYEVNYRTTFDSVDLFTGWVKHDYEFDSVVDAYRFLIKEANNNHIYGYQILECSNTGKVPLVLEHEDLL